MFEEKSFTLEQEEIIKECGSKWLRMGLSTESVDKKFMTGAVNDYYMLICMALLRDMLCLVRYIRIRMVV